MSETKNSARPSHRKWLPVCLLISLGGAVLPAVGETPPGELYREGLPWKRPGSAWPEAPPARLGPEVGCRHLVAVGEETLERISEVAARRLDQAAWEFSLAEGVEGPWRERFEESAIWDLAWELARLPNLETFLDDGMPPRAEVYSILGDLFGLTGRWAAAQRAYDRSLGDDGILEARCGASEGDRLYAAEVARWLPTRPMRGHYPRLALTGYLLVRDPETGNVLERHLVPGPLRRVVSDEARLELTSEVSSVGFRDQLATLQLEDGRLGSGEKVLVDPWARRWTRAGATQWLANLVENGETWARLAPGSRFLPLEELPMSFTDLEMRMREEIERDPTQPWYSFFLGQALWFQDERQRAAGIWRELFAREHGAIPYYDFAWMARYFEINGQPDWADVAYLRALELRRELPTPIAASTLFERGLNMPLFGPPWDRGRHHELGLERRYLWWQRTRELTGVAPWDDLRSVLWIEHFEARGDVEHKTAELERLAEVDRFPFLRETRAAWLDYSAWLLWASAVAWVGLLVLAAGQGPRRLWRRRFATGRWILAGAAMVAICWLLFHHVAEEVEISISYPLGGADRLLPESVIEARSGYSYLMDLVDPFAWMHSGEPEPGWRLGEKVQIALSTPRHLLIAFLEGRILAFDTAGRFVLLATFLTLAFLILTPSGRRVAEVLVPGLASWRDGRVVPAYLSIFLLTFAACPLLWLGVDPLPGLEPAPGPGLFSAASFDIEEGEVGLPLAGEPDAAERGETPLATSFDDLIRQHSLALLLAYLGARLFYALVTLALAAGVGLHVYELRRRWAGVGKTAREA